VPENYKATELQSITNFIEGKAIENFMKEESRSDIGLEQKTHERSKIIQKNTQEVVKQPENKKEEASSLNMKKNRMFGKEKYPGPC